MPIFLQYLLSAVVIIFACGYGYGQWKQGRNQSNMDNDSIYKGRIDALELKVKTQSDDIENLTEQVKKLRMDNEEANRKLLEAMAILQNRNPELIEFIKSGHDFMTITAPVIDTLKRYLDKQVI